MATTITIPDFDWSAFYYPELYEALIRYKRTNVPEHTDESAYDGYIQLLRAFALVGHINNVAADIVANESTLPTAKLVETVRNMLRLIGYEMAAATPAQVDIVYELSKVLLATTEVVSANAQAATEKEGDEPVAFFEALEALSVERTDQFSYVFAEESAAFTDYTTEANSQVTPGDDWTPWATPAAGDKLYFGHKQAMWDLLELFFTSGSSDFNVGVWEYYDGEWRKSAPTSVTQVGSHLEFDLTALLGTLNRAGTVVRVQLNETAAYEELTSIWTGSVNKLITTGLLGQTTPSSDPTDYTVGSDWNIIDAVDGTANLTADGELDFDLPQTVDEDWIKATINGVSAYWLRYRLIEVGASPVSPVIQYGTMHEGKQYVLRSATQGRSVSEVLGSSDGSANQRFESAKTNFIWTSDVLTVDGETWVRVDNFLSSAATDKHYRVELGDDDTAIFIFGDGVAGRIPAVGVSNVLADYRYGANNDGNVGANTVTVDKTGLTHVNSLWNPRGATGWGEAEGASEESLERAKIAGPASLRTREVALGPDDVVTLATGTYTDDSGAKPFSRAKAVEEGYGPKTIKLIVVTKGGGQASTAQLEALSEWFNGDPYAYPPLEKRVVANQEVTATNYVQRTIDVVAQVWGSVEQESVENALRAVIQPEALKEDGVTWEWQFGAEVPHSRIEHEIFSTSDAITKVLVTTPPSDVTLQPNELPVLGTVTLVIN